MADSFFGFNTTIPDEDGGGGDHEDEGEYDALNDETFGDAINGDWEDLHENLVLLDRGDKPKAKESKKRGDEFRYFDDLELSLSRVGLEDLDIGNDHDLEGRLQMDPSVWSSPSKSLIPQRNNSRDPYGLYGNPELFLRQNFSQPFNHFSSQSMKQDSPAGSQNEMKNFGQMQMGHQQRSSNTPTSAKIVSLEDLERSILNRQQAMSSSPSVNMMKNPMPMHMHRPDGNHPMQNHLRQQVENIPPGMQPLSPQQQQHQTNQSGGFNTHRLPPGFPPMHLMNNHHPGMMGMPPPNIQMPILPPPAGMHPNFSQNRLPNTSIPPPQNSQQQQQMHQRMPPHMVPPFFQQNMQNSLSQFNKRLVQEIQQNHPLLAQLNRMNNNHGNGGSNSNSSHNAGGNHKNNNSQQNFNRRPDANLNEFDEYANLMSTRDKQWLIGIQLMQLNTETPYIDDFYYTVYKERQKLMKGDNESKAHKDNTLNHPFTQPKLNHAHLLMMFGKNGANQRNGHHHNNRERKNSESNTSNKQGGDNKDQQQPHRTYTPLQFENSLGKLQCGSVTAPRKIIDMELVGSELSNSFNSSAEISVQRRSRQLLLHIEQLYRVVLKMEDLQNPVAIAAAQKLKEKKEKEKLQQQQQPAEASVTIENSIKSMDGKNGATSEEPETFNELLAKLLAGLTSDKVFMMMNVRKGKVLLSRIMPLIRDQKQKWDIWCDIISTLPLIIRKHPEDADDVLLEFYPEFRNQIQFAGMDDILRVSTALLGNDKKIHYIVESKFSILVIIAMVLRVEQFYSISKDLVTHGCKTIWTSFLNSISNCSATSQTANNSKNGNNNKQQLPSLNDNEVIKSLVDHFSRFSEVNSKQLINVLTQNENISSK